MAYPRPHIKQALAAAREAGKPVEGFAGDREMIISLERWGFLPINQDDVDERIAAWYVKNGLARRAGDTRDDTPGDTPEVGEDRSTLGLSQSSAAIEAAEAALVAASAALRLAKSMAS